MPLDHIIQKQRVLDTPNAQDVFDRPQEFEERFAFHVTTHVAVADLRERWNRLFKNLDRGRSAIGLLYADTGYGKTSTAASLWSQAEKHGIVAVPPFRWQSMTDMLVAAHGWVRYRLVAKHPEALPDLDQMYQNILHTGLGDLAEQTAREVGVGTDQAEKVVRQLKKKGQVSDTISPNRLMDYLKQATAAVRDAGYVGLLLLPDEFQLFETVSADVQKNLQDLKELLWSLNATNDLPLGCVVSMLGYVHGQIQSREPHMLARFSKPEGTVVNLQAVYGQEVGGETFPGLLWDRLATACELSTKERQAITPDVLDALGQFLAHPRSQALFSGPRSVVAVFRRAAMRFSDTGSPYTVFDLFNDYVSGQVCFSQQEVETAQAYTSIISQGIVGENEKRRSVVQLMCVMPAGVAPEVFQRHGIDEENRDAVVESLLAVQVFSKAQGPTLLRYKDDRQTGDEMVEILKRFHRQHNIERTSTQTAAVRGFVNHVLQHLFRFRHGAARTGWGGLEKMRTDLEPVFDLKLEGTAHEQYPDRTLAIHIGTEAYPKEEGRYRQTDFYVRFVLHTEKESAPSACHVADRGLTFDLDARHPFDPGRVPPSLVKLQEVFMPNHVTPLLLLEMLDFFDQDRTQAKIEETRQQVNVDMLRKSILNELTSHFFSAAVRASAISEHPTLDSVPIGNAFVERSLRVLIGERYPEYHALAVTHQWVNALSLYASEVKEQVGLGVRRGAEPVRTVSAEVPELFGIKSHTQFTSTYYPDGILRDLLRVDALGDDGRVVQKRIEVAKSQKPVAVWFLLHPLEQDILAALEASEKHLPVAGRDEKALPLPDVYGTAQTKGYTAEEVKQIVDVLAARSLVGSQQHKGQQWLYLYNTQISRVELERELEELEQIDAKTREHDLDPEWSAGHQPDVLRRRLEDDGLEDDELRKDRLRHDLREAAEAFKRVSGRWLVGLKDQVLRRREEALAARPDLPKQLSQTSGHPNTEFSTLLFMDIRKAVGKAFSSVEKSAGALADRLQTEAKKVLGPYENDKTMGAAVDVAVALGGLHASAETDLEHVREAIQNADALFRDYEQWRKLALKVQDLRLMLGDITDDENVRSLFERLESEQVKIKQHLADPSQTLAEVLDDHEHYASRVAEIENEYNSVTENRKDRYIRYVRDIEEELRRLLDQVAIREPYNPQDESGAYVRTREQAVERLADFTAHAMDRLDEVSRELLKPLEVFDVGSDVQEEAKELKTTVDTLRDRIGTLRAALRPDDVDETLASWVDDLLALRKESETVNAQHNKVQDRLRKEQASLTSSARTLLGTLRDSPDRDLTEVVIALRGESGTGFSDVEEILKSLVELYRGNWINVRITPTLQDRQPEASSTNLHGNDGLDASR